MTRKIQTPMSLADYMLFQMQKRAGWHDLIAGMSDAERTVFDSMILETEIDGETRYGFAREAFDCEALDLHTALLAARNAREHKPITSEEIALAMVNGL